MEMDRKMFLVILFISFFQLLTSGIVGAKEFPEKPIKLLVGYAPGSVSDLSARAVSKIASKYLNQPLVVVNMPGASATVSANELVGSTPDGYTISSLTTGYFGLTIHQQKVPFDPKIIKPLLGYWEYSHVLFIRADSPYAKLSDLITYGQKNPGAIKYGLPGRGTGPHLMGILFFRSADIKATDVPFKGTSENVQAVIGGHVTVGVDDFAPMKQFVRAGTVKVLVAFLDQRHKDLPEVPTSQEIGYPDLSMFNPLGVICIHRDTPPDRVAKLHDALKKTVEDRELKKIFDDMGQNSRYIHPKIVEETIVKVEKIGVPLLKEFKLFIE